MSRILMLCHVCKENQKPLKIRTNPSTLCNQFNMILCKCVHVLVHVTHQQTCNHIYVHAYVTIDV